VRSIFELCGLQTALTRDRNAWVHVHFHAWDRFVEGLGLAGGLRKSQPYSDRMLENPEEGLRCLDWVSATPAAIVALMWKLAFLSPARGGLRRAAASDGVKVVLKAWLCRCTLPLRLDMFVDADFKHAPPALLVGQNPVSLVVRADCSLDAEPLVEVCTGIVAGLLLASQRTTTLAETCIESLKSCKMSFIDFLSVLAAWPCLQPLLTQIALCIGSQLEGIFLREQEALRVSSGKLARCHLQDLASEDLSLSMIVKKLVAYRRAGFAAAEPFKGMVSVVCDGARVAGVKRLLGVTVLPTNVAIWWPPQALPCHLLLDRMMPA
jgi:hypothetical protein